MGAKSINWCAITPKDFIAPIFSEMVSGIKPNLAGIA
jgi:hypothetical protein